MPSIRLATRASPLALWQAHRVAAQLRQHRGLRVSLLIISSGGDADLQTPLYAMGNVGVFVKEVQAAVLAGRADAGVHSCKDLPTALPAGLHLGAVLERGDVRDALIGAERLSALPAGAVLGSSSTRRTAQARALRPDLQFISIRGNVATRLGKVRSGEVQATIMALAGLRRLELHLKNRAQPLDPIHEMIPAPGQGAVAVDCRDDDARTTYLLGTIAHRDTWRAIDAERAVLAGLGGGCSLPLGCWVRRGRNGWDISACMPHPNGMRAEHFSRVRCGDLVEEMLRRLRA